MSESTTTARIKLALQGQGVVEQGLASVDAQVRGLGRTLAGLAGGLTVGAFAVFVKGAINAADEMSKLSQKAGVAVKDVAGLQLAFRQSGVSSEKLVPIMAKLGVAVSGGSDALKSMGIASRNADGSLKSTRQVLGEVSTAFASYEAGAAKTALAVKLLGEEGAKSMPLFNGGAVALDEYDRLAEKLGLTLDESTVKAAEKFNDTIDLMGQGVQGMGRQIAAQLLPTLTGLASQFLDNMTKGDRLKKTADFLAAGLKGLYVVALGVVEVFSTVGKTLGGVSAAVVAALRGDFTGAVNILRDLKTDIGTGWKDTLGQMTAAWNASGSASLEAMATAQGAAGRAGEAVKGAAKQVRAMVDEFARLRDKLTAKDSGTDADFIKNLGILKAGFDAGRISLAEYLRLSDLYIATQPYMVAQTKALNEAKAAALKADQALVSSYANSAASAAKRLQDMQDQAEALAYAESNQIGLAQAVELTTIARLKEQQVGAMGNEAIVLQLQAEIEAREKIVGMLNSTEARDAGRELRKNEAAEWARTWDQVGQSFTDALMRGGKSVAQYLKDLFRTLVLRPILAPVGGVVSSLLGGAASAGQGASASSASSLLGSLGNIGAAATAFGTGMAASFSSMMAAGVSGWATAAGSLIGSGSLAGISAGLGMVAAPLAAAALLWKPLFGRKLKDSGIEGSFGGDSGFSGSQYQFFKGGLFRSDKTITTGMDGELRAALASQYQLLADNTTGLAGQLKLSAAALETYNRKIRFSTKGLTEDQIVARLNEEFGAMGEEMAALVLGTTAYTREGEAASATLVRLANSITGANALLGVVGQTLFDVGLVGANMASELADLFGGLDAMAQATAAYYQTYYTASERADAATAAMTTSLGALGLSLPNTNAGFRALVDGLDLTTEHGRTTYATLLQMAPEFAALQVELQRLADETAAQLIAAFTGRGRLVPVLDGAALSVAAMSGSVELAQLRAGRLGAVSDALALSFDATRITTAALNTGMTSLGVQQLLVQAGTGTLGDSLTDTQVRALALATGLTEAQVRAGALAGGAQGLAAQLATAAAQALGFTGPMSTINRLLGDAASGVLTFGDRLQNTTDELTPAQAAVAALQGEIFSLRTQASGTVVNIAGLAAALETVDTRTFVATVGGVFDLIGQRIKDTLSSISDERIAIREAASSIIGPGVMTRVQIQRQINASIVGMPSNAGVASAQTALANADAAVRLRESDLSRATGNLSSINIITANANASAANTVQVARNSLIHLYNSWADVRRLVNDDVTRLLDGSIAPGTHVPERFGVPPDLTEELRVRLVSLSAAQANAIEQARIGAERVAAHQALQVAAATALANAQALAASAATNARAAQIDYVNALQQYSLDASKAVSQLGRMREETVKYYESQKQMADLMNGTASGIRATIAAFRFDQLDPTAQLANLQERFNVAYSMVLSTTGESLVGYGQELSGLINPLLQKAQEAGIGGAAYANLVNSVLARADATAGKLERQAPKDYAAESLGLLGQIDSTLAALEAGALTADQLIVSAINAGRDSTRDGLRAVVAALTGSPIPAFAMGGMHAGGVRLVGENGPELEVTGPSRIYSAGQTRAMLGGSNNSEAVVAELQALRQEVAALRRENTTLQTQTVVNTGKTHRLLDRFDGDGLPVRNVPGETLTTEAA